VNTNQHRRPPEVNGNKEDPHHRSQPARVRVHLARAVTGRGHECPRGNLSFSPSIRRRPSLVSQVVNLSQPLVLLESRSVPLKPVPGDGSGALWRGDWPSDRAVPSTHCGRRQKRPPPGPASPVAGGQGPAPTGGVALLVVFSTVVFFPFSASFHGDRQTN